MSRVLITGGGAPLGAAVARLLLSDPAFDVRISDERPVPRWMREGCEVHSGDLRVAAQAAIAVKRCSHVIHLARFKNGAGTASEHTLLEHEGALHGAVIRAALERGVERFVYVSSPLVFERAELFPTPEEHLERCLAPRSAVGFARLSSERLCAAAQVEHGMQYAICRPFGAYGPTRPWGMEPAEAAEPAPTLAGPAVDLSELIERAGAGVQPLAIYGDGEQTLAPTHVDDLAEGIVAALTAPAAANEDFNLGASRELSLAEVAKVAWQAGADASGVSRAQREDGPVLKHLPARDVDIPRSCPSATKAHELLGWQARVDASEGIAALAAAARQCAAPPRRRAATEPEPC